MGIEEMRARIAESKTRAQQRPPAPPRGAKPGGKKKPKPEQLRHTCGHAVRPKQYANHKCPACTNLYRGQKAREIKQARAVRDREVLDFAGREQGRLPVGTMKTFCWTGTVWRGVMSILGVAHEFQAEGSTERKCLLNLHRAYMAWLPAHRHLIEAADAAAAQETSKSHPQSAP